MSAVATDKKIIIFNGPPGCGKDTAAKSLAFLSDYKLHATHNKMAKPLKDAVHKLFGLTFDPIYYDDPKHAAEKDEKLVALFGMSPREAYIAMSEQFVKPVYGEDAFGVIAVNTIKKQRADVHVYSDGGFVDEWFPMIDYVTAKNVLLIEIHANKDGKRLDFSGDSRGYIGAELVAARPGVTMRKVFNEFGTWEDREFFKKMCGGAVKKFLNLGD